ncbi:MAG: hypothetical protein U9R03_00035 [Candidatus Aerophobetes bacterium]|nr:hypothetical protein [Candidatus Aerophobetes bacterium]
MSTEVKISEQRMPKILAALANLGWEDAGEAEHPIKYPGCHKVIRGNRELFVAPAVEDYRCITIWGDRERGCICVVNTETMHLVDLAKTQVTDLDKTLADVPEIAKGG